MKMLFVCTSSYVSGAEIITLALLKSLRNRHELQCVTTTWSDGDFDSRLEALGIPYERMPLGSISLSRSPRRMLWTLDMLSHFPQLWLRYRRLRNAFRPDVVVVTGYSLAVLLLPLLRGQNEILYVHSISPQRPRARRAWKPLLRRIRGFVAVSRKSVDNLQWLGVPENAIRLILNGLTPDNLIERGRKAEGSPVVFGIVGQINERKGHRDLFDAIARIKDCGPAFKCRIYGVGDPEFTAEMQQKAEALGISRHLEWMGFEKDQEKIYRGLDFLVMPSRMREALPCSAIEATWQGLPIIGSAHGGITEVVQHARTGYLFEPQDAEALADCLAELINDPAKCARFGETAREWAREHASGERMVREFEAFCEAVQAGSTA